MKILRDPIWQFVGALLALLTIIIGAIYFLLDRPVKDLQIEVLSNSPLISVEGDITKDIKILYKDQAVQTLSVVLLRIENTGNVPIRETDYSRPVLVSMSPDAEVGEFSIVETRPKDIDLSLKKITPHQVELSKSLLNPGDQVLVKILVLDNDETLNVSARIADISELKVLSGLEEQSSQGQQDQKLSPAWAFVFWVIILFFISFVLWLTFADIKPVIGWRQKYFGLKPGPHYYGLAQETILNGGIGSTRGALRYLKIAFSWDGTYIQEAKKDPLFAHLQQYEQFKSLMEKYNSSHSKTHEAEQTIPNERSADQ
jgi:hypothetical protein